jgi:hypothetical protein
VQPPVFFQELAGVVEEMRQNDAALLLVTSREKSELYHQFKMVEVEPLNSASAAEMVRSKCSTMTDAEAIIIALHCGHNPLMMEMLASFLGKRPHKLPVSPLPYKTVLLEVHWTVLQTMAQNATTNIGKNFLEALVYGNATFTSE